MKKGYLALIVTLLLSGCATNLPKPVEDMTVISSAPASRYNFGYDVIGMNHGYRTAQAFDDSQRTFFMLPSGVLPTRAYAKGQISIDLTPQGAYWVAPGINETWFVAANNNEVYCATRAPNPQEACKAEVSVGNTDIGNKVTVATISQPVITDRPAPEYHPAAVNKSNPETTVLEVKKPKFKKRVVASDSSIERESITQLRERLESLQKQLNQIINQLKKEDNNA